MFCEVCDYNFIPSWWPSVHAHVIAHHEWEHGVRLRNLSLFESAGQLGDNQVLLIRPTSLRFARSRAERVSRRSIREPVFEGGYDKPTYYAEPPDSPTDLHAHALVVADGGYGVGILVLERRPIIQYYAWTTRPQFERIHDVDEVPRWTIVHVWLLPRMRARGLAAGLVRLATRGVDETPDTIGWLSPFSRRGYALMARVTQNGFHRACQEIPPSHTPAPVFTPER